MFKFGLVFITIKCKKLNYESEIQETERECGDA